MIQLGYDNEEAHSYEPSIDEFREMKWGLRKKGYFCDIKNC